MLFPIQRSHKQDVNSVSWMILSASAVAVQTLFSKQLAGQNDWLFLMFLRFLLPTILLMFIFVFSRPPFRSILTDPLLMFRAIFLVAGQSCLFLNLMHSNFFTGILFYLSSPLWIPVISILVDGYHFDIRIAAYLLLAFIGVLFILHSGARVMSSSVIYGVLSGFFNGCSQITTHKSARSMSVLSAAFGMYFYSSIILFFVLFLSFLFSHSFSNIKIVDFRNEMIILVPLVCCGVLNQLTRARAYSFTTNPSQVAPYIYCALPLSGLLDWLINGNIPDIISLVGMGLIFVSCLASSLDRKIQGLN